MDHPLSTDRWRRIEELFEAALDRDPDERAAFLDGACGDPELRREVAALLAADSKAERFLDAPAHGAELVKDLAATTSFPGEIAGQNEEPTPARGALAPGTLLAGRFRIRRFIDAGGMGEVYEALDVEIDERLALKTIRPEMAGQADVLKRLRREVRLAHRVTHPAVCRTFDLFRHEADASGPSLTFLTMELLEGETLARRIRRLGRLTPQEALSLAEQIAAGLAAAHEQGIVHRDLKSSNVILTPAAAGARAVVTDFGLARPGGDRPGQTVTQSGNVLGTPAFMAPEQLMGGEITPAADVYAFGVLMFEMLTGHLPFEDDNPVVVGLRRLQEAPPSPRLWVDDLDPRWESAILGCLEREPDQRFASPTEAVAGLRGTGETPAAWSANSAPAAQAGSTAQSRPAARDIATGPPPAAPPAAAQLQRRLALVLGIVLASAGLIYAFWDRGKDPSARPVERRSIALLGFQNLAGDTEKDWLSTALSEMLMMELATGGELVAVPGENVARMKLELDVAASPSLARDTLGRICDYLDADMVVLGSYFAAGGDLRLDLRLEDAGASRPRVLLTEEGPESEILDLVARTGQRLRASLELAESAAAVSGTRAALSETAPAARLYAEGLDRLRRFDALGARQKLTEAAAKAPESPLVHSALASAHAMLGYEAQAASAAERAYELAAELGWEEELMVEGRFRRATHDWDRAVEIHRALYSFQPSNLEHGLQLADVLTLAGRGAEAFTTLEPLRRLTPPARLDPRIDRAEAQAAAAVADYRRSQAAAARSAARAEELGARWLVAHARRLEGEAWWRLGEPHRAKEALAESERLFTELGDRSGFADTLVLLANVAEYQGELEAAGELYERALDLHRAIGNQTGVMTVLDNLGFLRRRQDAPDKARDLHEDALSIAREIGQKGAAARALGNLGVLDYREGALDRAAERYHEALAISRETGNREQELNMVMNLGLVRRARGDLDAARSRYLDALAIAREIGDKRSTSRLLVNLGVVLRRLGKLEDAGERYRESLELAREIGDPHLLARRWGNLAFLLHQRGDLEGAQEAYAESLAIHGRIDQPSSRAVVLHDQARLLLSRGEVEAARRGFEEAEALNRELGLTRRLPAGRRELARLALATGNSSLGERLARQAAADLASQGGDDELEAWIVVARALEADGRRSESRDLLAGLEERLASCQDLGIRLRMELAAARVAADPEDALRRLEVLREQATSAGFGEIVLEVRLARAEIDLALGRTAEGRQRLSSLASESEVGGFGLIAARAAQFLALSDGRG